MKKVLESISPQVTSERVDDLPLLLEWLSQMRVAEILDKGLDRAHGNRQGLSYGQLSVLFVAYIVSQSDHRLSHVESWVRLHHQTLARSTGWDIEDKDASDDRLADLLSAIGKSEDSCAIEEEMSRHIVQAYALPTRVARCDSSSFSVYHQDPQSPDEPPILKYGYSKDHRPDLLQYRHALGTIDPAGIPLVSATLPGNEGDDGMYYPFWHGLVSAIGHRDFVYIADAKASSYQTRAQLSRAKGIYCFPLPMTGQNPERLQQWVLNPPTPIQDIRLPGQSEQETPAAQGFEVNLGNLYLWPQTQVQHHWHERSLVIHSDTLAQRQLQGLEQRLQRTQHDLSKLALKQHKDCCVLTNQVQAILKRHRTQDFFHADIRSSLISGQPTPGRPSTLNPKPPVVTERFQVHVQTLPEAIEMARKLTGWRIYVTNATTERLCLAEAVNFYRQQWQVERGFHRFKRGDLPALPIFLQDTGRIRALMFLLTIALRVLTLMEFVVRQSLKDANEQLPGLYAGNPKRATSSPSAELLLRAFTSISLFFLKDGSVEISPLNPLQAKILALMRIPVSVYANLAQSFLLVPT